MAGWVGQLGWLGGLASPEAAPKCPPPLRPQVDKQTSAQAYRRQTGTVPHAARALHGGRGRALCARCTARPAHCALLSRRAAPRTLDTVRCAQWQGHPQGCAGQWTPFFLLNEDCRGGQAVKRQWPSAKRSPSISSTFAVHSTAMPTIT